MAIKSLPDEDSVLRHVNSQLMERDGDTVVGVLPQAFMLKPGEEYLSASWLEFFAGSRHERLVASVAATAKARTVKPSHGFAIGNVGVVKQACATFNQTIRVLHEPDGNPNPAYVAVRRYRSDDLQLLELLATEAWADWIEAKQYL
jgi:hypothetical protein